MVKGGAILLAAALAGCAPASPAPAPLDGPPRRVMSMNPCIDAILVEVADPAQIASISHYSHDPRATSIPLDVARRYPANNDTAEEAVALRPDLVLIGPHVAPATRAAIARAGVRIETLGVPNTMAESRAQVMTVARAVGHPERGAALVARIDAALARAAPPPGARPVPALIWEGGGLVPGPGTLADELLRRTGFANRSADYGLAQWDILPLERLVADPPRLVFTDVAEQRAGGRGLGHPALAEVTAMRRVDFPERLLQCAGPTLIEAARRLAAAREMGRQRTVSWHTPSISRHPGLDPGSSFVSGLKADGPRLGGRGDGRGARPA
jgi:iron complex transport system substrate-binding protein